MTERKSETTVAVAAAFACFIYGNGWPASPTKPTVHVTVGQPLQCEFDISGAKVFLGRPMPLDLDKLEKDLCVCPTKEKPGVPVA